MKKLLYIIIVLALVGCSTPAPAPEIQVVTVVVQPTQAAPTAIPPTAVPPTAVPQNPLPRQAVDYLIGNGFRSIGVDVYGENNCSVDYCIHYIKDSIDQVLSIYYLDGNVTGLLSNAGINASDGSEPGSHFGSMSAYVGIPDGIFNVLMAQLNAGQEGNRDSGGWRTVVAIDGDRLVIGVVKIGATRNTSSGSSL